MPKALKIDAPHLPESAAFIPLHDYMARCNAQYYARREAIGARGDFITAPEVSQMFGEILGAWAISRWHQMGCPRPFQLIELGPGKGTLMADVLRVMRGHPDVYEAVHVHLVETSPKMRSLQSQKLAQYIVPVSWHNTLSEILDAPFILLANEFLDALPIRQFVYTIGGWHERGVIQDGQGYVWASIPVTTAPDIPPHLPPPIPGNLIEACPGMMEGLALLACRMQSHAGSALFIDYGYAREDYGDTFQAVCGHAYADPLQNPGEQDLTAHVNFAAIERFAQISGLGLSGPCAQGDFLLRVGIRQRADRLVEKAETPVDKLEIIEAAYRLTSPDEMGTLFKMICLSSPTLPPPEGFDAI